MLSFLCFTLNCCCLLIRSIEIASSTLACLHILSVHPNVPNLLASCSITESREEGNGNDGPPVRWNSPTCPLDSQACAPAVGMGCSTCLSPPPPPSFFLCVCVCVIFFSMFACFPRRKIICFRNHSFGDIVLVQLVLRLCDFADWISDFIHVRSLAWNDNRVAASKRLFKV